MAKHSNISMENNKNTETVVDDTNQSTISDTVLPNEAVNEPSTDNISVQESKEQKSVTEQPIKKNDNVKGRQPASNSQPKVETVVTTNESIKVGTIVKLKDSTKTTVTGVEIPQFAYKNTYKVDKVLPGRIILRAGISYTIAVSGVNDIVVL